MKKKKSTKRGKKLVGFDTQVVVRCTKSQRSQYQEAARLSQKDMSDWARELLDAAAEEMLTGRCCLDTQLRYTSCNDTLADWNGVSVDGHLGKTLREVVPDVAIEAAEAHLRHVLSTGEPILNGEVYAVTAADPKTKRRFRHNYTPLKTESGEVVGVSCTIRDITETA